MLIPAPVDQNMDHLLSEPNSEEPVSYTHLDVYKRQVIPCPINSYPCRHSLHRRRGYCCKHLHQKYRGKTVSYTHLINIHNYDFMKSNELFSMLKFRVSYGLTGKTNFSLYSAKDMYLSLIHI